MLSGKFELIPYAFPENDLLSENSPFSNIASLDFDNFLSRDSVILYQV